MAGAPDDVAPMTPTEEILAGKKKAEPHELCGKRHSRPELVTKCEERHEARAADVQRRAANFARFSPAQLIRMRYREGRRWDQIVAELKKDYPPPAGEHARYGGMDWDLVKVVDLHSQDFVW